jgi:hypothetical protein
MDPEVKLAIEIADHHLSGASVEKRKALCLAILRAINIHATRVAEEVILTAIESAAKVAESEAERMLAYDEKKAPGAMTAANAIAATIRSGGPA